MCAVFLVFESLGIFGYVELFHGVVLYLSCIVSLGARTLFLDVVIINAATALVGGPYTCALTRHITGHVSLL